MSLFLAMEAVPFFDAFIFFVSSELVDMDCVHIHCIWIVLISATVISFLSELPPLLLGFWVCKFKP